MFHADTCLTHFLPPASYCSQAAHEAETRCLLRRSWHLVGTTAELARHGDFLTTLIADVPVQVRNFNGRIHALSNVCAHRHAMICSRRCGNSAKMQCQYHAWEYQADGSTGRIPQPRNFVPIDRQALRLPTYPVELVGQLVFVCVDNSPVDLVEFLGVETHELLSERFGRDWQLSLKWEPQYSANWKVAIENSLESYHVPSVHPATFREDPGGERSEHFLGASRTAMSTTLPFSPHNRLDAAFQRLEARFIRWLGHSPTGNYRQHHVFPNLLFSFTDALSLVNCIMPQSATQCSATVRQFGRNPKLSATVGASFIKRVAARGWARVAAAITRRILKEDQRMFAAIQSGLEHSPHAGVLGACEERIHCFQEYVNNRVNQNSRRCLQSS